MERSCIDMKQDQSDIISITKAFWLRKAGVTLSDEEAREAVENVSGFFRLLQQWHDKDQPSELKVDEKRAPIR